jgi:hypothetical protein
LAVLTQYWNPVAAGALFLAACGTIAPEGGGANDLPVSGVGPYHVLESDEDTTIAEPVVLSESAASLDDAQVLARGELLGIWYTRTDGSGRSHIRHVDFDRLEDGPNAFGATPFLPDQPWEQGSVAQPAVIEARSSEEPWLLFYQSNGAIGYAISLDHLSWDKAIGPALTPSAEEGPKLASPAAIRLDDTTVRVFYVAADGVRAADASFGDLAMKMPRPFARVPGVRVPLGAAPWLPAIGRITARDVTTAAGRRRHDLFLSGTTGQGVSMVRQVGMAASWDGTNFAVAAEPFLDAKPPAQWGPSVVAYRAGSLLLYTQTNGALTVIGAALSP